MPPPRVWSSRRPLYRANLVLLLFMTPLNVLGMLFPAWIETKVLFTVRGQARDVWLRYGLWRHCSDYTGCRWVHDDVIDADVGGWMYPINVLMVLSTLCQMVATVLGFIQNFMPRDHSHYIPVRLLRQLLHRDSPSTEDVAFLAGFFGTVSCIIFMLSTQEQISDGAHYQWAFAFAFLSSSLTVMASLTLTKSHLLPAPRHPNASTRRRRRRRRRRARSTPGAERERAGGAAASSSSSSQPQLLRVLRPEDIHMEEQPETSQAAGASASAREDGARAGVSSPSSSSSSRRHRSRSRERSRQDVESSTWQQDEDAELNMWEMEDIPVTTSSGQWPVAAHRRGLTMPVMYLEMEDLQYSASAPASAAAAASASEGACASTADEPSSSSSGLGQAVSKLREMPSSSSSSRTTEPTTPHTSSELQRTQL